MQWYTKREQGSRVNIWFSFNGVGQIVGGVVAYGIAVGTRKYGSTIASWKIVFLVTGLLTIVLGFIFLWIVPDNQLNARWLKKEDRVLAVARVRINQQGIGNKHFKLYQVKEALLDPMSWAFFFYAFIADIPNGGITNFFSQMVSKLQHNIRIARFATNLSPDYQLRLHRRTSPDSRRPRRRSRSHRSPSQRIHGPQDGPTHPLQSGRTDHSPHRHHPHRCPAAL